MENIDNIENKFYTRKEFAELCNFTHQRMTYHISNKNIDVFEKDGKTYIHNNEKNNAFINYYKTKK